MKLAFVVSSLAILTSCSGIAVERTSQLKFNTLFFAKVDHRKPITLEANESASGRVFVGLLSAGVIGAIATANTEEGFSEPKAFEYSLSISPSETRSIVSRSIADIGSCVEVISPDESELELLRMVSSENCEKSS